MSEKHAFPRKKTLTTAPKTWFLECTYCQTNPDQPTHEQELLAKVLQICKKSAEYHFREFLTAELDTLDHAKLSPSGQIEVLLAVHDKTGCDCLSASISDIERKTQESAQNEDSAHNSESTPECKDSSSSMATKGNTTGLPQADCAAGGTNATSDVIPSSRNSHHKSTRPSTMLDRLKIGPKGQGKTFR